MVWMFISVWVFVKYVLLEFSFNTKTYCERQKLLRFSEFSFSTLILSKINTIFMINFLCNILVSYSIIKYLSFGLDIGAFTYQFHNIQYWICRGNFVNANKWYSFYFISFWLVLLLLLLSLYYFYFYYYYYYYYWYWIRTLVSNYLYDYKLH